MELDTGTDYVLDRQREECGVFGVYNNEDDIDVARTTYYGLYSLQHRGQESAGIAVNDEGTIVFHKDMGLVNEVFNDVVINHLKGKIAIGHVRYSTTGASLSYNAQPMVVNYRVGQMALAHNGNLVNSKALRDEMESSGAIFQSTNDTEIIVNLISRTRISSKNIEKTLEKVMGKIKGSYAIVMITPRRLIGMRDPFGIRPLCIGKIGKSYLLASESCALDTIGAKFIRDVNPGEIVLIGKDGLNSIQAKVQGDSRLCIFEFVYFARPDSYIDGTSVHQARVEAGRQLYREHPVEADMVIGVPDGGLDAALGYSRESGIPYGHGLLRNRYVGRTFIQPSQDQRESGVKIKFNPMRSEISDKRVVMIDDSIVRGTTTRKIVQMFKEAGAREVHMRISSPPYKYPCHFGIDTPSTKQLVASNYSIDRISDIIGADSLGYLSLDGLLKAPSGCKSGFCTACFNERYPMVVPMEGNKMACSTR